MSNETAAMAALRNFFDEKGWRYLAEEDGTLRGLVTGDNGQWHWGAHERADARFLVFKAFCPLNVTARRRSTVAEYLMRANWGLNFGNFEMDWSDGQVCFRTVVTTEETSVGPEALSHLVFANQSLMDRYLPGLLTVACGSARPKKAVAEAEKDIPGPAPEGDASSPSPPDSNGRNAEPRNGNPSGSQALGRGPEQFSPGNN